MKEKSYVILAEIMNSTPNKVHNLVNSSFEKIAEDLFKKLGNDKTKSEIKEIARDPAFQNEIVEILRRKNES